MCWVYFWPIVKWSLLKSQMANGKWQMANGKWSLVNRQMVFGQSANGLRSIGK